MKTHIKIYTFLLFFFTTVTYSYSQAPVNGDSAQQENNTVNQPNNNPGSLDLTGNSDGNNGGEAGTSGDVPENTDNELLNAIMMNNNSPAPEYVKGTRLPNEYASGRTGGQYSLSQNPATAKPKSNANNNNNQNNNNQPDYGNGFIEDTNQAPENETGETKE